MQARISPRTTKVNICDQFRHTENSATTGIDQTIVTTMTIINPHKTMTDPDITVGTTATITI